MTRKQTSTILALDACLVAIESRALGIEAVSEPAVNDLAMGILEQVKQATNLLEQIVESI